MEMTVELFDNIINTSQDCVFWKDADRRFLGVNQAFLDFYGFSSADVLIGKTDEDMGWHSDPEPFRQDELRVLSGRSTYKVQGKCMIRGEERDIIASKRPLYDGDKIVGLVGSFIDVTDVLRRKEGTERSRVYSLGSLRKYAFFDRIIDEISLDEILDPLTGILTRAYSAKFVRSLISERRPFTFTMLDLDNFKFINDNFGHSAGDIVLTTVSKMLAQFLGEDGLVGRFGGDELLMIDLKHTDEKSKNEFFEKLYTGSDALRIKIEFDNGGAFITGTAGAATFPSDADDYTALFELIDKMLYLGKSRGRNCYTIYDKEKHSGLEITKMAKRSLYTDMYRLKADMERSEGFEGRLGEVMPHLAEILQIPDIYYITPEGRMRAVTDGKFDEDACDIAQLMTDDMFSGSTLEEVEKQAPVLYRALKNNSFESVLIAKSRKEGKIYGYIVCAVTRSHRIWQENECAILYYVAGLLTG